ncbi:MAG: DUF1971 domain-containing protein [Bdellovibrionales bacterium]|nr:DUF1971 domain-containing protein [Bdellovibrionales bacterium]
MKNMPQGLVAYKRTDTFNELTIPKGLLNSHTTKAGTWGKICVNSGALLYVIEQQPYEEIELNPQKFGVVEPQVPHHVQAIGEVEFYVEFYK